MFSCIASNLQFGLQELGLINIFLFLQEELGLEYDEDVGVSLQSFSGLLQHGKKRTRDQ